MSQSAFRCVCMCVIFGALMTASAVTTWFIVDRARGIDLGVTAIAAIKTVQVAGGADQALEATQTFLETLERSHVTRESFGCEGFVASAIDLVGEDVATTMQDASMSDEFDRKSGQFVAVIQAALRACR